MIYCKPGIEELFHPQAASDVLMVSEGRIQQKKNEFEKWH